LKKAKVAVDSYDDRIDPVGACVEWKVLEFMVLFVELGRKIDVINYTSNIQLLITRALSPAKFLQLK
jgi:N utilization substance protein A